MKIYGIIVLSIWFAAAPAFSQDGGRITVTGQGSVNSVPDMATISMGVTTQAKTAAAALNGNSVDTSAMLAVLAQEGLAAKDIQTSGLSLSPIWNNRNSGNATNPTIVGYSASNQVTIRVRDLARLGAILDTVVQAGATQFHGLSFGLQDPVPALNTARIDAVKDAGRKAALYADAAGISLGSILEINESSNSPGRPVMAREMAMSSPVPIAQGEISISASIVIVYQIDP